MVSRILVLGCGFGGIEAAFNLKRLLKEKAEIIAIDKDDEFVFHAFLPEFVSGKVSEKDITIDLNTLFKREGVKFVNAEVKSIDFSKKGVGLQSGVVNYDFLVVSLGSETAYYGINGAKEFSIPFKGLEDAKQIRESVLTQFQKFDGKSVFRVAVIGGGLSGIELVMELKDLLQSLCKKRRFDASSCEVALVEAAPRLKPTMNQEVGVFVENYLKRNNVKLFLGNPVAKLDGGKILFKDATVLDCNAIVWCAGISPSSVVMAGGKMSVEPRCGLVLNEFLQTIDQKVYALGDCAFCQSFETRPILTAWRAVEQGDFVGWNLYCDIVGKGEKKLVYDPRRFPALISLGSGMGILSFDGLWKSGKSAVLFKKLFQKMHMWRYKYNIPFLEYVLEFFVDVVTSIYFMRLRRM